MAKLKPFQPARNLAQTYNAVNPDLALQPGDSRYVDFAPWRGGENIADIITRRIVRANAAEPRQHLKPLVAGHRGCGKSTELLLLRDRLETEGYFVVYFDAALELDMNDVDYTDILLVTMHKLVEQARESPFQLKLDERRLDDLAMRLARMTIEATERQDAEIKLETEFRVKPEIPFFVKMMTAIQGVIKSGSTYKKQFLREVKQRPTQFLEDLNDLIDHLQIQLRDHGMKGLVIIIDSLDRILLKELNEVGRRTTHSAIYDLLHLMRYACDRSDEKITRVVVDKAIQALVNKYAPLVPSTFPQIHDEAAETLLALERMLTRAEGFALGFVRVNVPTQRMELVKEIRGRVEPSGIED